MDIKIYKNEFTGEPEEARYEIRGIVTIYLDTIVDLDKTLVDGKMSLLDYIQENIDIAHPRPIHHLPKKVFEELGGSIEKNSFGFTEDYNIDDVEFEWDSTYIDGHEGYGTEIIPIR